MQDNINEVKLFIVTSFAAVTSWLGILAIPVYLLVCTNVIDYTTGIMAAPHRGEVRSSQKGKRGIIKKVSMWLLVVVGAIIDQLILYSSELIGITLPFTFLVSCIVALWLCANELISILENLSDILGEDMPGFLLPLVKNIRKQVENKTKEEQYYE